MINHDKKYIHIPIPKTASQSIVHGLGSKVIHEPALYHNTLEHFISEDYLQNTEYYSFSFVRNPWDRLASLWRDFTTKRGHQYSGHHRCDTPLLSEFDNFEDMCLHLSDSLWSQNLFFRPQAYFLSYAGEIGAHFVGRFENLQEGYNTVCAEINIAPIKLPLINQTVGPQPEASSHYQGSYSDKSANAVAEFYKLDIETFGYEF